MAVCYLGILLAPHSAIHQATDPQEPLLAGDWRGSFGHKNVAAGVMAMLLFLGIYIARSGALLSGAVIIGLSSLFLFHAAGKSSLTLCFAVLLLTSLTSVFRSFWVRAILLLTPLLLLNMLSVGTVMSEGLAAVAKLLPLDSTFTGRTDIWNFALDALRQRLATGYGFVAFWGSKAFEDLPAGKEWAAFAAHSHNGYLDTALGMGLPGLILLIVVLVIEPLRNFQQADQGGNNGPLAMALLRIWLFGLYLSSMESFFLDRADPLWFTFLMAVFGRFRTLISAPAAFRRPGQVERSMSCARTAFATSCHHPSKSNAACTGGRFQRGNDAVGVGVRVRSPRHEHDGAAIDQFLEARMMVEFVRQRGAGHDQRPAGLHAGKNAGAARGEPFIERITERVDRAEQPEHLVIGGDEAGYDHVIGDPEFCGAGMEFLLDLVDAADEGADIDDQRLEPALLQDRADLQQRIGLLGRIDRTEMADHQPAVLPCRNETPAQFRIRYPRRRLYVRRQRGQHAFFRGPAHQGILGEFAPHQRREHDDGIGEQKAGI